MKLTKKELMSLYLILIERVEEYENYHDVSDSHIKHLTKIAQKLLTMHDNYNDKK